MSVRFSAQTQMAYIDNSDTKKELDDAIRGNATSNISPNLLSGQVVPVIDINPKNYRRANIRRSVTSAGTVYTTPTDQDFYLTYFSMAATSITAGNNNATLSITPFGDTTAGLIAAVVLTGTAAPADGMTDSVTCELSHPIRLARGSAITYATNGTIAQGRCIIMGYTA